ncbi:DUF6338 family protein [Aureimonas sp. SK2]|uniref:DUF6338 family protein n=1 Tax=Aureimonas sp. SK2 TaxID=3015992 RepID=UPI0024449532|nr:DUF6338 family protein [Aureimonas sp. SK2]
MEPSLLLLQIAILFLPGMIWAHLDAKFATKGSPGQVEFIARAFVFGVASYVLTFLVYLRKGWSFSVGDLKEMDSTFILTPEMGWQVIIATIVGFVSSIAWMYGVRFKVLTRILQYLGATRTYGDEDVWEYTLNSNAATSEYVHVRDIANQIVYAGWLLTFSSTGKMREMVLRDVQVFDLDGNALYDTPRLYIARPQEGMHIEFPATAAHIDKDPKTVETDNDRQVPPAA